LAAYVFEFRIKAMTKDQGPAGCFIVERSAGFMLER
jgi:hypothetical protein